MGKNTTNDMTQGNCMRLLVQFFLPILAGNLFQQLYSFADSMVVGKGIGDTALAAVGNTGSVHFLIIGFAIGLTGGLGICISQSFGSGNYEKLRKELAMSVWICLAIGIVDHSGKSGLHAAIIYISPYTGRSDDGNTAIFRNNSCGNHHYNF